MAVGEIADIAYISPDRSPVHLSCSKAGIVEITADNRLIGRAVGDTQVSVNQSGKTLGTVAVTVTKADFQGIFFDPGSLAVEVDDTMHPKVFAMVAGSDPPRNAEIAPEWIATEKRPSAEFAGFDAKAFELTGVKPTNSSSPQQLGVRMGNLKAAAPVEVVVAPCRLELTPAGPIDLPLGQMMRLQGFANYSGGRRVQVRSERLKWFSQEKSVPGLELYDKSEAVGAVGAVKAGAGPLNVYANYHGQESNRVTFKSVEADPNVKLDIDVDRTLRIAGEQGRVVLTASGPSGDVELVPSLTVVQELRRQGAEDDRRKDRAVRHRHSGQRHGDRQPPGGQGTGHEGVPRLRSGQGEARRSTRPASACRSIEKATLAALPGGNGSGREQGETAGRTAGAGRGLLHRPAPGRAVLSADPHRPASGGPV